eukprot:161424_1
MTTFVVFLVSLITFRQSIAAISPSHYNNYFIDTSYYTTTDSTNPCNGQSLATLSTEQNYYEILSLCKTITSSSICFAHNLVIANGVPSGIECQSSNQTYGFPICTLSDSSDLNSYLLISRLQDINQGMFSSNLKTTGIENDNNILSNTYSIIGNMNPWFYRHNDGKFHLKLIYSNIDTTFADLTWKQSSWITDSTITGYEAINVADQSSISDSSKFKGLGYSASSGAYLDGNGGQPNSWGSVGRNAMHTTGSYTGIPGFLITIARSETLYIVNPQYELLSHLLDVANGYFSSTVITTGLENTANTYCNIGNVDFNNMIYKDINGKYNFKLVYINYDGSVDEMIWRQTSWITDGIIVGYEPILMPDQTAYIGTNRVFLGLGYSGEPDAYLDGNGNVVNWYNPIGIVTTDWTDGSHIGIPGPTKVAYSYYFYIYSFYTVTDVPTINPTNDPTINPTNVPTVYPTYYPSVNPSVNPTQY